MSLAVAMRLLEKEGSAILSIRTMAFLASEDSVEGFSVPNKTTL